MAKVDWIKRREQESKARIFFSGADDYTRGQVAAWGTAFTTYEDEGEWFCKELNRLCVDWRAGEAWRAQLSEAGDEFTARIKAAMSDPRCKVNKS